MENVIEVTGLTKKYGDLVALDNFSLEVKKGEILGLLGPNGCGKSTFINTVLSLLSYEAGTIKIFGQEMSTSAYQLKQDIGVVFQEVAVFDELNVYQNIDYFCSLYIKDKAMRKQYVQEAIEFVGLEEFVKFAPKKLSGGLLRRLNIACGVAHKPKLIFLDEPTVAVDPQSRNNILEGIKQLNAQGASIVYTSHYMEEVEQLCDKIVIMDHGKLLTQGTTDELKDAADLGEKITLVLETVSNDTLTYFTNHDAVTNVEQVDNTLTITFKTKNNIGIVIDYVREHDVKYNSVFSERPTLNDVFLKLTGKELRD